MGPTLCGNYLPRRRTRETREEEGISEREKEQEVRLWGVVISEAFIKNLLHNHSINIK